jgi:fluoride exporter
MNFLLVGLGGALGAMARYGLSTLIQRRVEDGFPWGTLVVNLVGCLAIGLVLHGVEDRGGLGSPARLFATVGVIGGFTTFSAFGFETLQLIQGGRFGWAFLYATCSVVLGVAAIWMGRAIPRLVGA